MPKESPSQTVKVEWQSWGEAEDAQGTPLEAPGDEGVMGRERAEDYARHGNCRILGPDNPDVSDTSEPTPMPPADKLQGDDDVVADGDEAGGDTEDEG